LRTDIGPTVIGKAFLHLLMLLLFSGVLLHYTNEQCTTLGTVVWDNIKHPIFHDENTFSNIL